MLRSMIVDSNSLTMLAIKSIFEENNISVIAESDNGLNALRVAEELDLDLIIIDIDIKKISGIELIEALRRSKFNKIIIVTAAKNDIFYSDVSAKIGANGFVRKKDFVKNIIGCINATLNGYGYFPSAIRNQEGFLDKDTNALNSLSIQEIKVMKTLLNGAKNKEIAYRMGISDKTVSTYKKRLFSKLGCNSTLELMKFADKNIL
ncbi:TPA: response regulator [Klebsiella variicola subsp. variicola]